MTPSVEQILYWIIWLFGVLYSLFTFCRTANDMPDILEPSDFTDGWTILKRNKDVSDIEWAVLTSTFKKYWILLLIQVAFTQVGILKSQKVTLCFYSVYSVLCLILIIGPSICTLYIVYVLIMYAAHTTKRKSVCYGITVVSLYLMQQEQIVKIREVLVPEKHDALLSDVGFVWLVARCLSFAIDRINACRHQKMKLDDFLIVVSYCFYLPTVLTGPLLTYNSFSEQVSASRKKKPFDITLLRHFLHPICGYLTLEFLLHYIYSSSVQFYPDIVSEFDSWSICGLGYALPVLFYLKYFVIYSLSGALAKLEHVELPPPPKCISRVNVPSILWRTFDRGLYLWLLRYIYFPVVDGKWTAWHKKILGLALSFAFVCMWHGMDRAVCAWTALNFINVVMEMVTSFVTATRRGKKFEASLSFANKRRIRALIATPHFMIMCLSSCFFLSNWDVGLLLLKRIVFGGWAPVLPAALIMYCGCCVAHDVKEWEGNKNKLSLN